MARPPTTAHDIESLYILPGHEAVLVYIRNYPGLSDLLLEAYEKLNELFGPNPQIELMLVSDPEAVELQQTLFGHIRTHLPVPEAITKLDEFDEIWFLDAVRGNLNFSLRFV